MIKNIVILLVNLFLFTNNIYSQWERIDKNFDVFQVNSIAEFNGNIYAACTNGLMISTDTGKSWNTTNINYPVYLVRAFEGELFVADNKLMRSIDSGKTWSKIDENREKITSLIKKNNFIYYTSANTNGYFSRNYSFSNGEYWKADIYYTYSDAKYIEEKNNVFYSNTNGWFTINTFNNTFNYVGDFLAIGSNGVEMDNDFYWIATDNGIYKINRTSKISKFVGLYHIQVDFIKIINNKIFAISKEKGVYCSTDWGKTWIEKNNGLYDYEVQDYIIFQNNAQMIVTKYDGIYISSNEGDNWVKSNSGISNSSPYDLKINSIEYINGNIYFLTDKIGIQFWNENSPKWNKLPFPFVNPIELITNKDVYFVRTDSVIYLSIDRGLNWKKIFASNYIKDIELNKNVLYVSIGREIVEIYFNENFTLSVEEKHFIDPIPFERINQIKVFEENIFIKTDTSIFSSKNNYKTIENLGLNKVEFYSSRSGDLKINHRNELVLFSYKGIYVSRDMGLNWDLISFSTDVTDYYYTFHNNIDYIFVKNTFYSSVDSMKTWTLLNTKYINRLDDYPGTDVCFSNDYIYCLDNLNQAIYRTKLDYLSNIENEKIDENIKIYPNPCNDVLSIDLVHEQTNLIEIYDLQANLVFQQSLNQFESKIDLDISSLPKSIYFLKINNKIRSIIKE